MKKKIMLFVFIFLVVIGLSGCKNKSKEEIKNLIKDVIIGFQKGDSYESVTKNLEFVQLDIEGTKITWQTSMPEVVSNTGKITRGEKDARVVITATLEYNGKKEAKGFFVLVKKIDNTEAKEYIKNIKIEFQEGDNLQSVTKDLTFPSSKTEGVKYTWTSEKPESITNTGKVIRKEEDVEVNIILDLEYKKQTARAIYTVIVKKTVTKTAKQYATSLELGFYESDDYARVTKDIIFPKINVEGVNITWKTSDANIISDTGKVTLPKENTNVIITAEVEYNGEKEAKIFFISVKKEGTLPLTSEEKKLIADIKALEFDFTPEFLVKLTALQERLKAFNEEQIYNSKTLKEFKDEYTGIKNSKKILIKDIETMEDKTGYYIVSGTPSNIAYKNGMLSLTLTHEGKSIDIRRVEHSEGKTLSPYYQVVIQGCVIINEFGKTYLVSGYVVEHDKTIIPTDKVNAINDEIMKLKFSYQKKYYNYLLDIQSRLKALASEERKVVKNSETIDEHIQRYIAYRDSIEITVTNLLKKIADDNKYYLITGIVKNAHAYDEIHNDITFELTDGTSTIYAFRIKGILGESVRNGDTVSIIGVKHVAKSSNIGNSRLEGGRIIVLNETYEDASAEVKFIISRIKTLRVDGSDFCKEEIDALEKMYNSLSKDDKALVHNYNVLVEKKKDYNKIMGSMEVTLQEVKTTTNTDGLFRAKGKIVSIEPYSEMYNNVTFTLEEDGVQVVAYRMYGIQGKTLKVGDGVMVIGAKIDDYITTDSTERQLQYGNIWKVFPLDTYDLVLEIWNIKFAYTPEIGLELNNLKAKYDALTDEQKQYIINYDHLDILYKKYQAMKNSEVIKIGDLLKKTKYENNKFYEISGTVKDFTKYDEASKSATFKLEDETGTIRCVSILGERGKTIKNGDNVVITAAMFVIEESLSIKQITFGSFK